MIATVLANLLFPLLAFCTVHKYEPGTDTVRAVMNKDQTTTLKGIFVLVIFFHHFSQIVNVPNINKAYLTGGFLAVGIFFMISGYVTVLELEKTAGFKRFVYKKIMRLYLLFLIFSITFNNFLTGLLFMYTVTSLAFRFVPRKFRFLAIVSGNILFVILCIVLNLGEWWYDDILPFSVGVFFAMYRDKVVGFRREWGNTLPFWILSCGLFLGFAQYEGRYEIFGTICSLLFSVFLILFLFEFDVYSPLFKKLGKYSWEIFFLHQMIITLFSKVFHRPTLIMIPSLIVTVILVRLFKRAGKKRGFGSVL